MNRRQFLWRSLQAGAAARLAPIDAGQAPGIVRTDSSRPGTPHGTAVGDPSTGRAIVWSRTDRPARMFVEYSTTERFIEVLRIPGPAALESSDYTARIALANLPAGQRIFYRVLFQDLSDLRSWSLPSAGSFATPAPPGSRRDLTVVWSADTVGQGWGINSDWGGLRLYETMLRVQPDVFVHVGDTIYADGPLEAEVRLEDGRIWRNVVTAAKSRSAETLDEFRGCYQYNLLDEHMRRFNAAVAQVVLWDDHEVRNNWYPTKADIPLLAARARQAFAEYNPIPLDGADPERIHRTVPYGGALEIFALDLRSYRGPNSENRQRSLDDSSAILGSSQLQLLKQRLASSRATWKVIASDLPIGLVVRDDPSHFEAVANGDAGPPLGRELEVAGLLRFIRDRRIRNVIWITGDVHYCAAHHYDPSRAAFTDFDPFWEFVAGPLHAGTFGPNELDRTFGPEVRFSGVPPGMRPNRPPSDGLQFFGSLKIDARTRALTASLHDLSGTRLYTVDLAAR
jgi:alkaline phosphatase D